MKYEHLSIANNFLRMVRLGRQRTIPNPYSMATPAWGCELTWFLAYTIVKNSVSGDSFCVRDHHKYHEVTVTTSQNDGKPVFWYRKWSAKKNNSGSKEKVIISQRDLASILETLDYSVLFRAIKLIRQNRYSRRYFGPGILDKLWDSGIYPTDFPCKIT